MHNETIDGNEGGYLMRWGKDVYGALKYGFQAQGVMTAAIGTHD